MQLYKAYRDTFPNFATWLGGPFQAVPAKERVWSSFIVCGGFAPDGADAKRTIALAESAPALIVDDLGGLPGLFEEGRPGAIRIGVHLVKALESGPGEAAAQLALERTILHEIVHWSLFDKKKVEVDAEGLPGEMGVAFELSAYGDAAYDCGTGADNTARARNRDAEDTASNSYDRGEMNGVSGEPIGVRNNNPGNVRYVAGQEGFWAGVLGAGVGNFTRFDTPAHGIEAMTRNIFWLQSTFPDANTLAGMISHYAPPEDNNDTGAYVTRVENESGVDANSPWSARADQATTAKVVLAMIRVELGKQPYSEELVRNSVAAAFAGRG